MVEFETVRVIARSLPGVEEYAAFGTPAFRIRGRCIARLRDEGVLVVRADPGHREVLIRERPDAYFVTPHYLDHPYVLVRLPAVDADELGDPFTDGWAMVCPKKLAAQLGDRGRA